MLELLKVHRYFFTIAIVYLLLGGLIIICIPKGQLELFINQYHNPALDAWFMMFTKLGEGWFSVLIVLILFFRKIYWGIACASCLILTTLITQALKHYVFAHLVRPFVFFRDIASPYYIEGLEIHSFNSFPSGHTSGAFTTFFFLALITRKKYWDIAFFVIAAMVGFSRIYLLQHFFIDTYFGSLIGIVFTFILYCYFEYYTSLKQKTSLNKALLFKS